MIKSTDKHSYTHTFNVPHKSIVTNYNGRLDTLYTLLSPWICNNRISFELTEKYIILKQTPWCRKVCVPRYSRSRIGAITPSLRRTMIRYITKKTDSVTISVHNSQKRFLKNVWKYSKRNDDLIIFNSYNTLVVKLLLEYKLFVHLGNNTVRIY